MKLYRSFHKQREFGKLYELISEYYIIKFKKHPKNYESVDWNKVGSLNMLKRLENTVAELDKTEYEMIINGDISRITSSRITYLNNLFWFMAKIQSDEDMIEEFLL